VDQNGKEVWFGPDGKNYALGPEPIIAPKAGTYIRTAVGPNGHVIGSNDGKTWYDVQTGKPIQ
jgi:hypothetical protein